MFVLDHTGADSVPCIETVAERIYNVHREDV